MNELVLGGYIEYCIISMTIFNLFAVFLLLHLGTWVLLDGTSNTTIVYGCRLLDTIIGILLPGTPLCFPLYFLTNSN